MELSMAIMAMKTRSMAPTLRARVRPWVVPPAMASRELLPMFSLGMRRSRCTSSVSGMMILAMTRAAGAFMMEATRR